MENWRVLVTPQLPGALNMAVDQTIANFVNSGKSTPTLRIYNWSPFCLSIGYHQNIGDLNLTACEKLEVDIVRRPTGGKAVFHANELTYSVIAPNSSFIFQNTISETYSLIASWLSKCLLNLNLKSELAPVLNSLDKKKMFRNPSCFSTASEYEITVAGKKIIGSAQRRWQKVVLQHGSFLIGYDYQKIIDLLKLTANKRKKMLSYLQEKTTCLKAFVSTEFDFSSLAEKFIDQWQKTFHFEIYSGKLTEHELKSAYLLMENFDIKSVFGPDK